MKNKRWGIISLMHFLNLNIWCVGGTVYYIIYFSKIKSNNYIWYLRSGDESFIYSDGRCLTTARNQRL